MSLSKFYLESQSKEQSNFWDSFFSFIAAISYRVNSIDFKYNSDVKSSYNFPHLKATKHSIKLPSQ